MKEDWLKDIHDKMANYETEAPADLWNAIRRAQEERQNQAERRQEKRALWFFAARSLAAAAVVTIVFVVGTKILLESASTIIDQTAMLPETPEASSTRNAAFAQAAPAREARHTDNRTSNRNLAANTRKTSQSDPSAPVPNPAAATGTQTAPVEAQPRPAETRNAEPAPENKHTEARPETNTPDRPSQYNANEHRLMANERTFKERSENVSLDIFATGGSGALLNSAYTGEHITSVIGPDDSEWLDDPMLGILLYNQGREVKKEIRHRQPFKVGFAVCYKFNDRISLGSGVTYSFLKSDTREGSESHFVTGEQKLHYIGIPLNLKVRALSWKGLEAYATAGFLAEKCVDGEQTTDYVLDNSTKKEQAKSLREKPLQWSANLSAGVQYNISSWMAVYAEPGVSYYFDNGSAVETIYKEKPLNFNLNFGIRFSLGKK